MNRQHSSAPLVWLIAAAAFAQSPDAFRLEARSGWNVLYGHREFLDKGKMALDSLEKPMSASNTEREKILRGLTTRAEWDQYRAAARARFLEALGTFPPRTPLNAKVTGKLDRSDYEVEKILFESRPRYYVTANAYVPKRSKPPFPAVLCPVGHWGTGKFFEDYQRLGIYLARRGFLVLVFDLPGQGERQIYYDSVIGRPLVAPSNSEYYTVIEHAMAVGQTTLVSGNLVPYLVWDGLRALDYLISRKDVDPRRIACTGTSGGGLQTEILSALDERIKVSIPVSYGGCAADHPDRVGLSMADVDALIAPRPLLMMAATGDSQASVVAKRERHAVVARVYNLLGVPDRTAYVVGDGRHGYLHDLRATAWLWLSKWLLSSEPPQESLAEAPTPIESPDDLACTVTGQVKDSLGGESILTVNRALAAKTARPGIEPPMRAEAVPQWREKLRAQIISRLGFAVPSSALNPRVLGRTETRSYILEKLVYYSEPGVYIPSLLLLPKTGEAKPAVVFVNDGGKSAGGAVEELLLPLVQAGYVVLAIDPRGAGETTVPATPPYNERNYRGFTEGSEADLFFAALRINKTVVGLRVLDVVRGAEYLASRPEVRPGSISAAGQGSGALLALYAAALDSRIRSAACTRMLRSYADILDSELYAHPFSDFPPRVLQSFDLPEVAASIAPKPLLLLNLVNQQRQRVRIADAAGRYQPAAAVYNLLGAAPQLHIRQADSTAEVLEEYRAHLAQ